MNKKFVVIIILNFNKSVDTIECINSLKRINYSDYKIILIDNCSTDDSFKIFSQKFPDIIKFRTEKNIGYTGGINQGFVKAFELNPEFILVLNNDTIVTENFLSELVKTMENNLKVGAAGGLILAEHDRRTIWFAGGKIIHWRGLAVHFSKGNIFSDKEDKREKLVDFLTGCMVLYRTDLLRICGLEDERFFMYLDDIELSSRIVKKGYKLIYVPKAIIYHKVFREKENPFKLYYSVRNRLLLINEMNRGVIKFISKLYFIIVIILKLIFWKLINNNFFNAAKFGLQDYLNNHFYEGRGFQLFYDKEE